MSAIVLRDCSWPLLLAKLKNYGLRQKKNYHKLIAE